MRGRGGRPISRRSLLRGGLLLAIGGAATMVAGGSASALGRIGRPSAPAARLAAVLPHSGGAARLGRAALAGGLVERDVRGLLAGLAASVPDLHGLLLDGDDDEVRAALDLARRQELAAHGAGLMRIDGWVVARTEARICALIALA